MMMGWANNNDSMYIMHLWLICLRWAMVKDTIWNSGWVDGTRVSEGSKCCTLASRVFELQTGIE